MRMTPYKKVMIILVTLNLFFLIIIAYRLNVFDKKFFDDIYNVLESILSNEYVSSIVCSIIEILILYIIQLRYSKIMIKKDTRCNEVMQDLDNGIKEHEKLEKTIPHVKKRFCVSDEEKELYYEFYKKNKYLIELCNMCFVYENNSILIESVQSCFFINLNFKLLNIINNIKNRIPNLKEGIVEIELLDMQFQKTKDNELKLKCGDRIAGYLLDLKFMAEYVEGLLGYLEYDSTYEDCYNKSFSEKYDIIEYLKEPDAIKVKIHREIAKEARKKVRKIKWERFWK